MHTQTTAEFAVGIGRAMAGALIFSLPILMTMEMWALGHYADPLRVALMLALTLPLLVRLSHYGGFRRTGSLRDDLADALVSIAVAAFISLLVLLLMGAIGPRTSIRAVLGMVALQVVCGSIGAMLARSQLGSDSAKREQRRAESTYSGELFLMVVGALFLSLNVAPTEEVVLVAGRIPAWQQAALMVCTLAVMHVMVYRLEFRGGVSRRPAETFWGVFACFTVVGYVAVLATSLYVLWTFGRTDGMGIEEIASLTVVLAFPGAIGASVARLVL